MVHAPFTVAVACIVSMLAAKPTLAEYTLSAVDRSELAAVTQHLGELMRQDVEETVVDGDHMVAVPLIHKTSEGTVFRSMGALVPFFAEGRGAGNSEAEYVALFILIDPDDQLLQDFSHSINTHKHVGLLGFTQINAWFHPHWDDAVITEGTVTVPVDVQDCGGRHGTMTVHLDNSGSGPRIGLTFDKGATLETGACVR